MRVSFKYYFSLFQLLSSRRRLQIFYLFLLSILSAISETANIGILVPFLGILSESDKTIYQSGFFGIIYNLVPSNFILPTLAFCFLIMIIMSSCIRSLTIRNQTRLGSLINADLGKSTFSIILNYPYEWHLQSKSSKIISLLTQDVERVGAIVKGTLMLCVNFILIGIVGGFLFLTSLQIMLAASLSLGIFYFILFTVFRYIGCLKFLH